MDTRLVLMTWLLLVCAAEVLAGLVPYDIVYVRQVRYGDTGQNTVWPDVGQPARMEPGADLMLLHPDGTEEVLVAGGNGSVTDPMVSLDGAWVYYSLFPDLRPESLNAERNLMPRAGADLYKINIATREIVQLTHGEFTPNDAAGAWDHANPVDPDPQLFNSLGYGVMNTGPCPLPDGRVMFTSTRRGFELPRGNRYPVFQLYVMDEDGSNVEAVGPMSLSGALHPVLMRDGRIIFSSHEAQGTRDRRQWSLMAMQPDGRHWTPVVSSFRRAQAFHFPAQLSDGRVVFVDYYNFNNKGFGALRRLPEPGFETIGPFHSAVKEENPRLDFTSWLGDATNFRMPFTPVGMESMTPFTHGRDKPAPLGTDGTTRVGKFSHPAPAPSGELLVSWSPGSLNDLGLVPVTPYIDSGIYLVNGSATVTDPDQLIEIKNDPAYNECFARPVVPWASIYGSEPASLPWLPNDGTTHTALPAGTPYGMIGSASVGRRETAPGFVTDGVESWGGFDPFLSLPGQSSNWSWQGADAGIYTDEEIYAIRVLMLEPNSHRSYGPAAGRHYLNHAGERMRILGEMPVVKPAPGGGYETDMTGAPDTSFLARIPADTPFTFQTLDRKGMVLNMAQTWHQLRPGELRNDCGGCHAHSQVPMDFNATLAGAPGYVAPDMATRTPLLTPGATADPDVTWVETGAVDVEFYRDIRPILQRSCIACHTQSNPLPPGNLVLDDYALYNGVPGDYARLADDRDAQWGHPPLVDTEWQGTNASRYVRMFQSRRSLLMWKLHGARLDGWDNADHPSASIPGDVATLPVGANPSLSDLDYTGTQMPPPGSGVPALSDEELMTVARWIDLGCPIDLGRETGTTEFGWFLDELPPILTLTSPRAGTHALPLTEVRLGLADAFSGVAPGSLSVTASVAVNGRAPGLELADLVTDAGDGVYVLPLSPPLTTNGDATLTVRADDLQGNRSTIVRRFSVPPGVCAADFDQSGLIDFTDLDVLLQNWQSPVTPFESGDADGSGVVDFADLNVVLSSWGTSCGG